MKHAGMKAAEPYVREIPYADPVDLAARLLGRTRLTLLDSSMSHPRLGRYSYLSCDPSASLIVRGGVTTWNGAVRTGPALRVLDRILTENRDISELIRFIRVI